MGKKRIIQKAESAVEETPATKQKQPAARIVHRTAKGRVYIQASYNNTLISLTDEQGNLMAASSAGALGFRGPKKATPFAANKVVEALGDKIQKVGLKDIIVYVKGIGSGREAAIRALVSHGLNITAIKDITPLPHNGPRPPKPRRV